MQLNPWLYRKPTYGHGISIIILETVYAQGSSVLTLLSSIVFQSKITWQFS